MEGAFAGRKHTILPKFPKECKKLRKIWANIRFCQNFKGTKMHEIEQNRAGARQAVADLHSKILDVPPPPRVQILSISCSFWENLTKSYVGPPEGWRPPRGYPASATARGTPLDPSLILVMAIFV